MDEPYRETLDLVCEVQSENERLYGRPFAHLKKVGGAVEGPLPVLFIDGFLIAGNLKAGHVYRVTIADVTGQDPEKFT